MDQLDDGRDCFLIHLMSSATGHSILPSSPKYWFKYNSELITTHYCFQELQHDNSVPQRCVFFLLVVVVKCIVLNLKLLS